MARKTIPARPSRDRSRSDESLLLRSAESLGRVIGSLQRQLDIATGRIAASKPNGSTRKSAAAKNGKATSGVTRSRGSAGKKSSVSSSGARRAAKKR
jgi:hypothetical protein